MRVFIYTRYSSDLQSPTSTADQERDCRARAQHERWVVVAANSDEAISGGSAFRPGYQTLLRAVRERMCDIVLAEALDRLSRDQEDLAGLYKRCKFAGIAIITLTEGVVEEWHVGLKGTMSAVFLKDVAAKTRRGLRGRVAAGASAGGISYGYRKVKVVDEHGVEAQRGFREVDEEEAAVIVRIAENYAYGGLSPKRIAANLNAERVPGPNGGQWSQSTINGNRRRGTGILNNELYVGQLVWNRLTYVKDPDSGKRVSRLNPAGSEETRDVPHLRIISDELWKALRARQAKLDALRKPTTEGGVGTGIWSQQRPRHLFSKLIACDACGGGVSMISKTHLGCSAARNKGDAICSNRRTIARAYLEAKVLDALRTRLMSPDVYASFVRGFTAEWNKEQGARATEQAGQRAELGRLMKKIGNLTDAIAENGTSIALQAKLKEQEARRAELEIALAAAEAPAPRLLPNLAEVYRAEVARLHEGLDGDDAAAVRERVRALVEEIRLIPSRNDQRAPLQVEVRGKLAALLALGLQGTTTKNDASSEELASQVKLVAGAGFEPAAFRL